MKIRAEGTRSTARRRLRRFGLLAVPSGATLLLAAFFLPSSCTGSFMSEVSVNVLAEAIAPQVTELFSTLRRALFEQEGEPSARARQQVGLEFAEDLARGHRYWCDRQESEKACVDRIAPRAAADFAVELQHWDQFLHQCRQAVIDHPTSPPSDEIRMIDDIFACMEKRYPRQIATLRESGPRGP